MNSSLVRSYGLATTFVVPPLFASRLNEFIGALNTKVAVYLSQKSVTLRRIISLHFQKHGTPGKWKNSWSTLFSLCRRSSNAEYEVCVNRLQNSNRVKSICM